MMIMQFLQIHEDNKMFTVMDYLLIIYNLTAKFLCFSVNTLFVMTGLKHAKPAISSIKYVSGLHVCLSDFWLVGL